MAADGAGQPSMGSNHMVIVLLLGIGIGIAIAVVAVVGIPVSISTLGFTGAGIAAGFIAAKMMSPAAIANGGGVAAGSTVAVLQSIADSANMSEKKPAPNKEHKKETTAGDKPNGKPSPGNKQKPIQTAIEAAVRAGITALGFTGAAAITNSGGVAADRTVAVLQSIEAADLSVDAQIGLTSVLSSIGAATRAWLSTWKKPPGDGKPHPDPSGTHPLLKEETLEEEEEESEALDSPEEEAL